MHIKRENLILLVLLPVITAACILLWYLGSFYFFNRVDLQVIPSMTGTYDLRGIDFENTVVRTAEDVEFIPDALLTPDEFEERAALGGSQIGKPQRVSNVSTSRVRLLLPSGSGEQITYAIAKDSIDFAQKIYINGVLHGEAGSPGLTRESEQAGYALWNFSVVPLSLPDVAAGGEVEIVQQASNFVHRHSGGHTNIYIGSEDNIRLYTSLKTDFDGIVVGLFLALFFVHMTLYFTLFTYRANIYCAALCLTWALRTGVTGAKIFPGVIPFLTWEAAFRVEYISIPVSTIFILLIVRDAFPAVRQKWPARAIIGVSAAFGLLFLFADTLLMSYAVVWYNVFYIAAILWVAVRLGLKLPQMRKRNEMLPEHWAALFGLAVFMYAAVHDAFYYIGIYLFGLNSSLADLAMLIFTFSLMTAMTRSTMREFSLVRKSEQRLTEENARLETHLREIISKPPQRVITHGTLKLDTVAHKAFSYDEDMRLSPKEFSILCLLLLNEGEVLSATEIYEQVWKQPMIGDNRALQARVSSLRTKLKGSGYKIDGIYGKGYCLRKH